MNRKTLIFSVVALVGALVPASAQTTVQWFDASIGDKVSLYGDRLEDANMYGLGIESSAMYFRSLNVFRWYANHVADGGASDLMELENSTGLVVNKMITANGSRRGMLINGDDQDSCLTFHDANNSWYSMGMDYSDNRVFKINYGGSVGETEGITMNSDGDIGFGTSTLTRALNLAREGENSVFRISNSGFGNRSGIEFARQRSEDQFDIGGAAIWTDSRNTYNSNLIFHVNTACNVGSGAGGNYKRLTMDSGTGFLFEGGRVGIGVQADTYQLEVAGTIRAKEIIVESGWADYVFDDDYKLPSLSEVETHIAEFGHLPGIPIEEDVQEQGVSLGEMNVRLLQKVEELTLYTLQQERMILKAEEKLDAQRSEIETLQDQVSHLLERIDG